MNIPWSSVRNQWKILPPVPKGDYLAGKNVIITGANSGVGLEALKQLVIGKPAQLILAVRSVEPSQKIVNSIKKSHPGLDIQIFYLDLTSLESIKSFTVKVKNEVGRVDVLINNAGINPNFSDGPYKSTGDGYERTFQTNTLGPFLTSLYLLPELRQSPSPKVIFVGSDIHFLADDTVIKKALKQGTPIISSFNDASTYKNGLRYAQSKLLLQMLTRSLIPALPDLAIINTNPGMARTNLGRDFDFTPTLATIRIVFSFVFNARSAANAARNISTAVANSTDSHDYWSEGVPYPSQNVFLTTGTGVRATKQFYEEMLAEVEKIAPGVTKTLI
ncbi:hypothetical protein CI109_104034 [Kwoniella shandongensis]|uniref:Uncharacterized protein n=1 Tax=Kwoniella shandongensis TaxID=1734106 RepID=A0A5M6BYS1_9TREE|nr:uncharacterized protein CI109_004080 [Kwoniella shandongensis]KAA5527541.1 hypothetical protein CI109_004080 [Kwoniella shandongensis]